MLCILFRRMTYQHWRRNLELDKSKKLLNRYKCSNVKIKYYNSLTDDWQCNRWFPSSLMPLFQSKSKCETILMKITLICMKIKLHAEPFFIWKILHVDSFWNRGKRELGNGLLEFDESRGLILYAQKIWYFVLISDSQNHISFDDGYEIKISLNSYLL